MFVFFQFLGLNMCYFPSSPSCRISLWDNPAFGHVRQSNKSSFCNHLYSGFMQSVHKNPTPFLLHKFYTLACLVHFEVMKKFRESVAEKQHDMLFILSHLQFLSQAGSSCSDNSSSFIELPWISGHALSISNLSDSCLDIDCTSLGLQVRKWFSESSCKFTVHF